MMNACLIYLTSFYLLNGTEKIQGYGYANLVFIFLLRRFKIPDIQRKKNLLCAEV